MKKRRIVLAIVLLFLPIKSFAQEKTEIITFNIHHSSIHVASPFQDIKVEATITDPRNVAYASVNYRAKGERSFKTVFMTNPQKDMFEAIIPAMDVLPPGIEYFIFVMDIRGVPHVIFKDPKLPQSVAIAEEAAVFEGVKAEAALEEEFGLFAAENVVYAAAKREQKITETSVAISVISDDEISDSGALEIYDVMRKVPGVDVMTVDPSQTLVGARGFLTEANRYMLVLVDGMVMNDELFGQAFWTLLPITAADIKRIEVIRGPGSALYGANAYSGVTSIMTKSPKDAKGLYAFATRSAPLDRDIPTLYTTARGGGEVGGFGYRISANKTQVNSWFDPQIKTLETVRADALVQYEASGVKGTADFGFVEGDVWVFSTLGPIPLPINNPHVKLSCDYKDAKVIAYWSGLQTEIGFDHIPGVRTDLLQELNKIFPVRGRTDTYNIDLQHTYSPHEILIFTYGASFRDYTLDAYILEKPHNEQITAGGFLQTEFRPIENLILTGSARGDWNSVIKKEPWTLSPRVSINCSPVKDHTFRASWGVAFRKPSFLEYGMRMQGLSEILRLSNPDLVNEVNRSTEFGYAVRLTDRIKANLDLYYSQYRKFIEFDAHELMFVNTGDDADGYGGELNIDAYIMKGLDGFANYAYFNAIPKGGIDYSIDTRVSPDKAYPHHKVNAGFRVKHEGLTFNIWAHYVSSFWREIVDPNATTVVQQITRQVFMKDYVLLNAKLGYKFSKEKTEIGITAFNFLNIKHREFPGFVWDTDSVYEQPRPRTPPESFGGQEIGMKLLGFIAIEF